MKKKHFYAAVILLAFLAAGIQPAHAAILVPSETTDINGTTIATYNNITYTYTLIEDVTETLIIQHSGLILDGGGHTVTGPGPSNIGVGVDINAHNDITVRDLNITGFSIGINISGTNPGPADPKINTVENNTIYGCTDEGIRLYLANDTILRANIISNNYWGILIETSGNTNLLQLGNTLTGNTLTGNEGGVWLKASSYNTIYNNNFIGNIQLQAYVSGSSNENNFDYNYWSDYTGADTDGDGIGDTDIPHLGLDDFPWVVENGWSIPVNQSPTAAAGPDQTVEQESPAGAWVTLDGFGSSDDGQIQPLTYTWAWAGGGSSTGFNPTVTLPPGTTTVTLTVYDGALSDTDTVEITVQSAEPPEDVVEGIIDYIIEDMYVPEEAEKEMDKAVKDLNKAIDEFNNDRIDKALNKIAKAVKQLMKAQEEGANTQGVIKELVDLVKGIAYKAIEDAIVAVGADNLHVVKAQEHYDKADGKYDAAIKKFKNAYKEAMKALGE